MYDAHRISMARINLVSNVKYFWKIIMCDVNFRRSTSILSWDQIRDILKKKYIPAYYMDDLLAQFLNLTSTVIVYMSQFEVLQLRCEIDEEQRLLCLNLLMV